MARWIEYGTAITTAVVKAWVGDVSGATVTVASMLTPAISDIHERRAALRNMEATADMIAAKIESTVRIEFRDLSASDIAAAVADADQAISTSSMDGRTVIRLNMEPVEVERAIRESSPDTGSIRELGESGSRLYDLLISEAGTYIVTLASRLPDFGSHVSSELLVRTDKLVSFAEQILDRIPSGIPSGWGEGSASAMFETRYLQSISKYADQLQLFGVSSEIGRAYSLSVAYISLSVEAHRTKPSATKRSDSPSSTIKKDNFLSIETALAGQDRVLVTGLAGSGKTTLIQWLATTAAQDRFPETMTDWNNRVPFVVPLRRFVGEALPAPEQFVSTVVPAIANVMPSGWTHQLLDDGRAVVLIDGVDEIPANRRKEVRTWLDELMREFPRSKFVVTSRSTAVSDDWARLPDFTVAVLQPMELPAIVEFVNHWHDASLRLIQDPVRESALEDARRALLKTVRDRRVIRQLATSPLLCALLCALNRDRGSQLPRNRMQLYSTAIEMLAFRRDDERAIRLSPDVNLTFDETELLLRSVAVWLHENGKADASMDEYEARIASRLAGLHNIRSSAHEVAVHLLARSGLLRQPVPGRVDFVHRTFLEYLAAADLVAENSIEKLVLHAEDDHWREVVILAAGHAHLPEREQLISGLINRGDANVGIKHRLHLLAVACMETSPELRPETQARLAACLESVMPPHNMTDAAAIASAADLAVPLLVQHVDGPVATTAASVRALSLIGGDEALVALRSFGPDRRVTVSRQLIRAWSSFDTERYAVEVLANSPLDTGNSILVRDAEQLPYLRHLNNLAEAGIVVPGQLQTIEQLPGLDSITVVDVSQSGMQTLKNALRHSGVAYLNLSRNRLTSLEGIQQFPSVETLDISANVRIDSLSPIAGLDRLEVLYATGTTVSDYSPISDRSLNRAVVSSPPNGGGWVTPPNSASMTVHFQYDEFAPDLFAGVSSRELSLRLSGAVRGPLLIPGSVSELSIFDFGNHADISLQGGEGLQTLDIAVDGDSDALLGSILFLPALEVVSLTIWSRELDVRWLRAVSDHDTIKSATLSHWGDLEIPLPDGWRQDDFKLIFARDA